MPQTLQTSQLKYRHVARELRRQIEIGTWPPGEHIPAEHELAKRFGVALMTIRQAIASLADDGIVRRVQGKGTFVLDSPAATGLVKTRWPMAFLLPTELRDSDYYYFPEVMAGFQQTMDERRYRFTLHTDAVANQLDTLEPGTAIACLLFTLENAAVLSRLRDNGFRVLAINRYRGRRSIPCVRIDDVGGIERAVDHLATLGHQRIGFVAGSHDNLDAGERLFGFHRSARRRGLLAAPEAGYDFSEESGYQAACQFFALDDRPTAIVCASDRSAVGVMKAASVMGLRVPDDLSVVGFGDFSVARYLVPSLTTVRQARATLGQAAAEALIHLANDDECPGAVLPAEILIRDSTAPPA